MILLFIWMTGIAMIPSKSMSSPSWKHVKEVLWGNQEKNWVQRCQNWVNRSFWHQQFNPTQPNTINKGQNIQYARNSRQILFSSGPTMVVTIDSRNILRMIALRSLIIISQAQNKLWGNWKTTVLVYSKLRIIITKRKYYFWIITKNRKMWQETTR